MMNTYDEDLMLEDLEAEAYYPDEDHREIALFDYPNALNFDKWGIFTNETDESDIPEHLCDRLENQVKVNFLFFMFDHYLDLLTYYGTPLGEATEGYDEYLVDDRYPNPPEGHPKAGQYRFKFYDSTRFEYAYIFPNGWGIGVETSLGDGATLYLVQDGNPEPALYAPDWWPSEQPKDPADLFELVFNAPQAEEVAE